MNWTLATIKWGLPHNDNRVKWELWTSSNDASSVKFKQNFKDISLLLGGNNNTIFEPQMYILNGANYGCNSPPYLCGTQCTNQGRYCSVYPQYNAEHGISGIDVVQENLRNLCVWNYTKYKDVLQHNLNESSWWDYVITWDLNCGFPSDISKLRYTEACSYGQMDIIDPTKALKNYVKQCIIDSGGYGKDDAINWVLQDQVTLREMNSVYSIPIIRVNEFLLNDNIDSVLAAICSRFINNTQPDICYGTYSPAMEPTLGPSLTCDVGKDLDRCGQCLVKTDPNFDDCVGCDGIPYSGSISDCMDICNGPYKFKCGACLNSSNIMEWNEFNCDESHKNEFPINKKLILYGSIGVLSFIIITITIISCRYCKMKKQQQNMQNRFNEIINSYEGIMDNNDNEIHMDNEGKNDKEKTPKIIDEQIEGQTMDNMDQ